MVFPYHSILLNDLVSGHNMLVCKMHSENIQRFSGSFFSALTFNSMTSLVKQANWIMIAGEKLTCLDYKHVLGFTDCL